MAPKRKRESSAKDLPFKLPRLPHGFVPCKRALNHAAIPSPPSAGAKVIYVSARMPFMAAVKRVQTLLAAADKRETQAALDKSRRGKGVDLDAAAELLSGAKEGATEVVLKGTGKVVEKTLGLGLWFQSRDQYRVVVRTGSVGTIDDVVKAAEEDSVLTGLEQDEAEEDADTAVPRSRLRHMSVVEVCISRLH